MLPKSQSFSGALRIESVNIFLPRQFKWLFLNNSQSLEKLVIITIIGPSQLYEMKSSLNEMHMQSSYQSL